MKVKAAEKFEMIKDVYGAFKELSEENQSFVKGVMQGILISEQSKPKYDKTDNDNVA